MKTIYLVLALSILGVSSLAIYEPVLTWYRPCGLGVVIFEKSTPIIWRATINLDIYHRLHKMNIYINFEQKIEILDVSENTKGNVTSNGNNYTFTLFGIIPRQYIIYLKLVGGSLTDIPRVSSFQLNDLVMCNDMMKDAVKVESFNVTKENDTSFNPKCGQRLISSERNEVSADAKAGDWPWHVAILMRRSGTNRANFQCSGSVISRTAILAAGNTFIQNGILIEAKQLVVKAGVVDLNSKNQKGNQIRNVQKVIIHPDYNSLHSTANLVILKVNKLSYTEYVRPICLEGTFYDKTTLFGRRVVTTGFGKTDNYELTSTLRSGYTLIHNDTTCIAYSTDTYTSLLNEFTFCAGLGPEYGVNTRNGDDGDGVTVPQSSVDDSVIWFLRGVLTKFFGPYGSESFYYKYYVIYTDVAPYYGWIYHHAGL